jgi:hypothetical protein
MQPILNQLLIKLVLKSFNVFFCRYHFLTMTVVGVLFQLIMIYGTVVSKIVRSILLLGFFVLILLLILFKRLARPRCHTKVYVNCWVLCVSIHI